MKIVFLHGLDSSGNGTKGRFFKNRFPECLVPDFDGSLESRLQQLERLCAAEREVLLIGSSFGGLMATCFAANHPERVRKLILMAPALNFPAFLVPHEKIHAPTYLLVGSRDTVTPADKVIPLARRTFANLEIEVVDEDHLLHDAFRRLDWQSLLSRP